MYLYIEFAVVITALVCSIAHSVRLIIDKEE